MPPDACDRPTRAYHRSISGKTERASRAVLLWPPARVHGSSAPGPLSTATRWYGHGRMLSRPRRTASTATPVPTHNATSVIRLEAVVRPRRRRYDARRKLKLVEREAVIRMDDSRHRGAAGGEASDGTRLRGVRMDHVKPALAEQGAECAQRPQIMAWVDGGAQRWLDDHLQASRGCLIKQVVAAAGDDRRASTSPHRVLWFQ